MNIGALASGDFALPHFRGPDTVQYRPRKEVIFIDVHTALLIAMLVIAFTTLVLKIIEVARSK
jgi:hypothetical protein